MDITKDSLSVIFNTFGSHVKDMYPYGCLNIWVTGDAAITYLCDFRSHTDKIDMIRSRNVNIGEAVRSTITELGLTENSISDSVMDSHVFSMELRKYVDEVVSYGNNLSVHYIAVSALAAVKIKEANGNISDLEDAICIMVEKSLTPFEISAVYNDLYGESLPEYVLDLWRNIQDYHKTMKTIVTVDVVKRFFDLSRKSRVSVPNIISDLLNKPMLDTQSLALYRAMKKSSETAYSKRDSQTYLNMSCLNALNAVVLLMRYICAENNMPISSDIVELLQIFKEYDFKFNSCDKLLQMLPVLLYCKDFAFEKTTTVDLKAAYAVCDSACNELYSKFVEGDI